MNIEQIVEVLSSISEESDSTLFLSSNIECDNKHYGMLIDIEKGVKSLVAIEEIED